MTTAPRDSLAVAKLCARLLAASKVRDVQVIDVGGALQITDYFVLGTGLNPRHLRAASSELFKELRSAGLQRKTIEGHHDERWVLIDFTEVVVHLFSAEAREYYDLDNLWGECPRIPWEAERAPAPGGGEGAAAERLLRSS